MKKISIWLFIVLFLLSCDKEIKHIPYSDYIDCVISVDSAKIIETYNSTIKVDLVNHSQNDLSMEYLYVEIHLMGSGSNFYGSRLFEFNSDNGENFIFNSKDTFSLEKVFNKLTWNTFHSTDEIPDGDYILSAVVVTGDLNIAGNQIFSNTIEIARD